MEDTAKILMGMPPRGLFPDEEKVLEKFDIPVAEVLVENGFPRSYWTGKTANGRFVQLNVLADPDRVVLELPFSQIATLSTDELCSRLQDELRQH